jgi:hypothetical protein
MFVYGSQLGWFALEGEEGFLQYFSSTQYYPHLNFVVTLAKFRQLAVDFLLFGELMRPLEVFVDQHYRSDQFVTASDCVANISSSVWKSQEGTLGNHNNEQIATCEQIIFISLKNCCFLAGLFIVNGHLTQSFQISLSIDAVAQFGMKSNRTYYLYQVDVNGNRTLLQRQQISKFTITTSINPLTVFFFTIKDEQKEMN